MGECILYADSLLITRDGRRIPIADSGAPFDAVMLDLTIKGGMGGDQVIKELIKFDPNVKAFVSSGYFNDPVMEQSKAYGFEGAISKPYAMAGAGIEEGVREGRRMK